MSAQRRAGALIAENSVAAESALAVVQALHDGAAHDADVAARIAALVSATRGMHDQPTRGAVLRELVDAACNFAIARGAVLVAQAPDGSITDVVGRRVGTADIEVVRGLVTQAETEVAGYLAVPLSERGEGIGYLYLTGLAPDAAMRTDPELAGVLARIASLAVSNARVFDQARQQQRWSQLGVDVFRQVMSGTMPRGQDLVDQMREIADVDAVTLAILSRSRGVPIIRAAAGPIAENSQGWQLQVHGTAIAEALGSRHPVVVEDFASGMYLPPRGANPPSGPAVLLPVLVTNGPNMLVTLFRNRPGAAFRSEEVELAAAFAQQMAVAADLNAARHHQQRMVILEDRDRIARDLHDHVIQRLFAAGLSLEGVARSLSHDEISQRIMSEVSEIDDIIRELRSSILRLRGALAIGDSPVRSLLEEVNERARELLGFLPRMRFTGPVESTVDGHIAQELATLLREIYSVVVDHDKAAGVEVIVGVEGQTLTLTMRDDGKVPPDDKLRAWRDRMRDEALANGNQLEATFHGERLRSGTAAVGTTITWTGSLE